MRSRATIVVSVAAFIVTVATSVIAEPSVKASVDRTTVSVGRTFVLNIEASGDSVGIPAIPDIDGLEIDKRPPRTSSSTQISMINGRSSIVRTIQYGYYARATRVGMVTIPAISVEVDGQTLSTEPILLTVAAPQQRDAADDASRGSAATRRSPQEADELTWEDVATIESDVDKREVFQGEPVQLTLSLWRLRYPGLYVRGQDIRPPETEGFYATPLQLTRDTRDRNGHTYEVSFYTQILYPTTAGDLRIGALTWEGVGSYGFSQQRLSLEAPPIGIKVKPLPEQPAGFSGAVGTFTISAQLSKTEALQGVPITLTVRVSGRGNPDAIDIPPVSGLDRAYVADPVKGVQSIETPNGPGSEKSFTYTITPLEPGDLVIPSISFCYFDPVAAAYKTESTQAFTVRVLPSAEATPARVAAAPPDTQATVNVVGDDIQPIITDVGTLYPSRRSGVVAPLIAGVPVFAYGGLALFMRRKRRFENDTGFARGYRARSKAQKRLRSVSTAQEPSEELYRAVTDFVADEFNVSASGMTSSDVEQLLGSRGFENDLIEAFRKILRACERARYASVQLSADEIGALVQAAGQAMDRLDSAAKRSSKKASARPLGTGL